ncbi:MAG: hypothetical protein ACRD4P_17250 [Bryobacteraceae bacterium]
MKVFQSLTIRGLDDKLRRLPDEIGERLTRGWSRNRRREAEVRQWKSSMELYCFHCDAEPPREAADLWISSSDLSELRISNIVPTAISKLSYSQYNTIFNEFAERFAMPAAEHMGLTVTVSKPDLALDDLLPPDTFRALVDFSENANRMTLASHPMDRERWESFVTGAHRAHAPLDADTLSRWLIESGWPGKAAHELSMEYEQGRSLLEKYERQLQNA